MEKRMWGFYSKQADEQGIGTLCIYRTVDGREVRVTAIMPTPDGDGYLWQDKVACGEVVEYVRIVRESCLVYKGY